MTLDVNNTKWNLGLLFKGDDDPLMVKRRKEVEKANYAFINKWKERKDYLRDAKVLKEALDEYETLAENFGTTGDEGYYLWLRTQQDQNDSKLKAKFNKLEEFSKKIENDIQFFTLRLARIPVEQQKIFLNAKELEKYRHLLEKMFENAKYLLSEPEEKLMNLKSTSAYSNWVKMVSGFLAKEEREVLNEKGKKEKKNFSEIFGLISSTNKKIRDSAAKAFNEILGKHVEVAEAELNSILLDKKVNDELRKLPRPDSARHVDDDIESEIVDNLVKSVSGRFEIAKKYYELKAKLMGVKKLQYHERNVPYGKIDKKYSYGEAANLVFGVFNKLDEEFGKIFANYSAKGQIDVFPKKDKKDGAFCVYWRKKDPIFIMLNHNERLNDVLTLSHELGHGINDEFVKKKQPAVYFGTPKATAEVASTFMEDFVLQELEKKADDELKLAIMMAKLNDDITTILRQIACYMFEQELHKEFREKGYLSKEEIGKLFQEHMSAYMGDAVEQSPGSENWWVYWSHIRDFFYNYSYASGLLISKFLQGEVKKNPKFIAKVKEFLSAGTSDSPKNIFMKMGIDISKKEFWDSGLKEIEDLLNETEKLAKKLGKI
jgi:oligoendopeptidase F